MKQHSEGFSKLVADAKKQVRECSVEDVRSRQEKGDDFWLVDVREDDEWRSGHVVGAVHLGKGVIERDVEKTIPDRDANIVLYCGGGFRSALAAEALQKMGYRSVLSMDGGWSAWKERGYPTQKP